MKKKPPSLTPENIKTFFDSFFTESKEVLVFPKNIKEAATGFEVYFGLDPLDFESRKWFHSISKEYLMTFKRQILAKNIKKQSEKITPKDIAAQTAYLKKRGLYDKQ